MGNKDSGKRGKLKIVMQCKYPRVQAHVVMEFSARAIGPKGETFERFQLPRKHFPIFNRNIMSQPKALPLLKQLMQIQSTTKQEDAVATFLATHLTQQGWSVSKQPLPQLSADTEPQPARSNVFAYLGPKPTDEKTAGAHTVKVLLNSHLDTVPPYIEYREDETKVYGRGACDAKGSVAVQVQAVTELLEEGKIQQGDVG